MKALSASQVELFTRCQRKWAFRYTTNLPRSSGTFATSLGTEVHKVAEVYQTTGQIVGRPEAIELFKPGLPFMPHPKTGRAESRFDIEILEIPYMGFMDWRGEGDFNGTPFVVDYKTSSDPAKYGLKGHSDFLTHVQPLLYATTALREAGSYEVYLRWIYFKTKGKPKAYTVESMLNKVELAEAFHRVVHAPAKEIVRLRVLPGLDPNSLAPNRGACHDFNTPCEYAAHCEEDTTGVSMGLLEDLQSLTGDSTKLPTEAPPADLINRPPRRVSSRPPSENKTIIVEVDPKTVKKAEPSEPAAKKVVESAEAAPRKPSERPPATMRSPVGIILEELSVALDRAAKRIG